MCVPLFAKRSFANSPLVALISLRSISTSAEVDHRHAAVDPRSLFEKIDAKAFKIGEYFFVAFNVEIFGLGAGYYCGDRQKHDKQEKEFIFHFRYLHLLI